MSHALVELDSTYHRGTDLDADALLAARAAKYRRIGVTAEE